MDEKEDKPHVHHMHEPKKEAYTIKKETLWQIVSAVLAIIIVVMWFTGSGGPSVGANTGGGQQQAAAPQPTQQEPQGEPQRQQVSLEGDPVKGDADAPVTIVEFADFQCPYCGRFYQDTLGQIEEKYIKTGKVKMVYKDFPLSFHPEAQPAAEAAECAHEQGKFWEFHDQIYQNQGRMGAALYTEIAQKLGLDMDKFNSCVETGKYRAEIQEDFSQGSQAGISGTPGFLINGIPLIGAHPFQNFQQVIEAELAN